MKIFKLLCFVFTISLLGVSCKHDPCESILCQNGGACLDGSCACPIGYTGDDCTTLDLSLGVQQLLNLGFTPKELHDNGVVLDALYGKIYEGGFLFYLNTIDGSGIVAATEDRAEYFSWGCTFSADITAAEETDLGTGGQNTQAILAQCDNAGIAARICDELELSGKDDWFLPSKGELILIWENLADPDGDGENEGLNDPNNVGDLHPTFYWSSSQNLEYSAWSIAMYNGRIMSQKKAGGAYVRAVRYF